VLLAECGERRRGVDLPETACVVWAGNGRGRGSVGRGLDAGGVECCPDLAQVAEVRFHGDGLSWKVVSTAVKGEGEEYIPERGKPSGGAEGDAGSTLEP
jgi:hypothetical protein